MEKLTLGVLIFVFVITSFGGIWSAVLASASMYQTRKKAQSPITWAIFIAVNVILGIIFKFAHPSVYVVALIVVAFLQLLNREGKLRRQSWNTLAVVYAIDLVLSVVSHLGKAPVPSGWMLFWIIPIILPFITGWIQTVRLNIGTRRTTRKNKKSRKMSERTVHIIGCSAITVLTVAIVLAVILIK